MTAMALRSVPAEALSWEESPAGTFTARDAVGREVGYVLAYGGGRAWGRLARGNRRVGGCRSVGSAMASLVAAWRQSG